MLSSTKSPLPRQRCRPPAYHLLLTTLCLLIASRLIGCRQASPPDEATLSVESAAGDSDAGAADSAAVAVAGDNTSAASISPDPQLRVAGWDEIENEIAAAAGSIVVVDLWSHGCPPCLREFPELVALSRRYPQGLVCIGINLDYIGVASRPAESYLPRVEQFLIKQQAAFPNFVCSTPDSEVYERLGISSLPAILIFDAQGGQVAILTESVLEPGQELTYADRVEPLVRPLVQRLLESLP